MSDHEERLDEMFSEAFETNDAPLLDWLSIKFDLKELQKQRDDALKALQMVVDILRDRPCDSEDQAIYRAYSVACDELEKHSGKKEVKLEDLRGIAPDATGYLSREEFVRKIRDEWL